MNANPLLQIPEFGQSIWLDFIRRQMLTSGELESLIEENGLRGVTSNPSIFEKAIAGSRDYDDSIRDAAKRGQTAQEIYELLTVVDIQNAADLFLETFEKTKKIDGWVSLEVSPHLAHDTEGTIAEAQKLHKKVDRPNVLIKVPATGQGIPAIRKLIAEGISVNVTLLFGLDRYAEVIEAYLSGLETRVREEKSIAEIASVASFFVSRIDVAIDARLPPDSEIRGKTAIASAKMAYQMYKDAFRSERFQKLKDQGAQTQRLLWASTSTKNAADSDVKYVEALIGPETINTVPLATLHAYRDHGNPENRLETDVAQAEQVLQSLAKLDINLKRVTRRLEDEGVLKFSRSFDQLIASIEAKKKSAPEKTRSGPCPVLANCEEKVQAQVAQLQRDRTGLRLWQKDATLWKSDTALQGQIKNSLGWLHIAEKMEESLGEIDDFVQEIKKSGFEQVVHMGMGGSSLAPLVFARTFSAKNGLPLAVLDTTDPSALQKLETAIPVEKTLFIVASKSGTTAEPLAFKDYFYERVGRLKGSRAGENFIAITDPNTPLVDMAHEQRFRRVFLTPPDIGGRYSALTYFGLVPAALMGVDIGEILNRALRAAHASASCVPGHNSSALILGAALGEMVQQKRNKVTLLVDPPMEALGLWLEQLMAESTGKEGTGLIPIVNEPLGPPSDYGEDRLFIYLKSGPSETLPAIVSALQKSGQPIVTLEMADSFDLGQEFFRWEFATAVAGSILGINAFDQPNVQASKENTNRLLARLSDPVTREKPKQSEGALSFYSNLHSTSGADLLRRFLKEGNAGDYVALMAFLPESPVIDSLLQGIRKKLRDRLKFATTLGYGPRFLHSTGQLHKGGPNTGIFIQLTADAANDMPIPKKSYTFGMFEHAQAQGDLEALRKQGRRALRIHLGHDIERSLKELDALVTGVLRSL